jgi:hypothetical protein
MKPGVKTLSILFLLIPLAAFAQEYALNLSSRVVESFDEPDKQPWQWVVQGSKFATQGYPEMVYVPKWPEALWGRNKGNQKLQSLGIHAKFDRKAYNTIEIIPTKEQDGKTVSSPIPIPGRVKSLDLWVWGSNYDYYLEAHLRDINGVDHMMNLGSIKFAGWRNLSVMLPNNIPQTTRYVPSTQTLELTKLVIWTQPSEKVDDFYCYIDQIKVLTDVFESRFDGDELADTDVVGELWKSAKSGTGN